MGRLHKRLFLLIVVFVLVLGGNLFASQYRVAIINFTSDDHYYRSMLSGGDYTTAVQSTLPLTPEISWVERTELNTAINELNLGAMSFSNNSSMLRLGKWVKADLLVLGHFVRKASNSRMLILEVVFTDRAVVLARREQVILGNSLEPVAPGPKDLETTVTLLQQALFEARREILLQQGKILVAPLFFRNLSDTSRLDYLEKDIVNTFQAKGRNNSTFEVLSFLHPRETTSETELVFLGLIDQDKTAWQRVADVYVWGSYKEEKAPGVNFGQVPVTVSLSAFDGSNDLMELSEKTVVAQLPKTMDNLVGRLLLKVTSRKSPVTGDHRQSVASILKNRAGEIQQMLRSRFPPMINNQGGNDTYLESTAGKSQRKYCVEIYELARFFDPTDADIYRQLIWSRWKLAGQTPDTSAFDIQYRRACDFDHYLKMFGIPLTGTVFDAMFMDYARQSMQAVLSTLHFRGRGTEVFPIDLPDLVFLQWQAMFARQYIDTVKLISRSIDNGAGPRTSDYLNSWLEFGLGAIDDPKLKVELIEAIWPYYHQNQNNVPMPYVRSIEDQILDVYVQIGQPERARTLLHGAGSKKIKSPVTPSMTPSATMTNAAELALRWERQVHMMMAHKASTQQAAVERPKTAKRPSAIPWIAGIPDIRPAMVPFPLTDPELMRDRIGRTNFNGYFEWDYPQYDVHKMIYHDDMLWFFAKQLPTALQPKKTGSSSFYGYAASSDNLMVMDGKIGKPAGVNDLLAFRNRIWMATLYDGVWSFDPKMMNVRRYTGKDGLLTDSISAMAAVGSHIYFVGRDKNDVMRLSCLDTDADRWSEVLLKNDKDGSRIDLDIFSSNVFLVGFKHWLFLGKGKKGLLIDTDTFITRDLSEQLGLPVSEELPVKQNYISYFTRPKQDLPVPSEFIRGIAADEDGLWFIGRKQFCHLNPETQSLEKFPIEGITVESVATQNNILWLAASVPSADLRQKFVPHTAESYPDDGIRHYLLAWHTSQHKWLGKMEIPFYVSDIVTAESCLWVSGQYVDSPIIEISTSAISEKKILKTQWLTELLKEKSKLNQKDSFESTPLMLAAQSGHLESVRRLVDAGADVNVVTSQGFSSLMIAARRGRTDVVKYLIEHGASVQSIKRYTLNMNTYMPFSMILTSPLMQACQAGQTKAAEILIDNHGPVDERDFIGSTPLILAVQSGNLSTVNLLLSRNAAVDLTDASMRSPLWWAAYYGYDDIVESLVRRDAKIDSANADKLTPLYIAVERANTSTAKLLLKNGANPFYVSKYYNTVLSKAIALDNYEICKACLDSSSHSLPSETVLIDALNIAIDRNRKECFDILISRIKNVNQLNSYGNSPLERALLLRDSAFLQSLYDHGLNLDVRVEDKTLGEKALLVGVEYNSLQMVQTLLDRHVNPNICDSQGRSALCLAVRQSPKMVEMLLRSGADPKSTDKEGKTVYDYAKDNPDILVVLNSQPTQSSVSGSIKTEKKPDLTMAKFDLILACQKGFVDEVRSLLGQGADPNVKNASGWPVLVLAAAKGQTEIVRALLENHADVNATGVGDWTALMQAAGHDQAAIVQMLIDHGVNMLQENNWNKTAYDIARDRNCRSAMKLFEQAGITRLDGRLLITATGLSSVETMMYLLENGANVDGIDGQGRSALFEAADLHVESGDNLDVMKTLFKYGANPNLRDHDGFTPIIDALRNYQAVKIVSLLLDHGADPDIAISSGDTSRRRMENFPDQQRREAFMKLLKQKTNNKQLQQRK
jgi:ankyrin repeat protein